MVPQRLAGTEPRQRPVLQEFIFARARTRQERLETLNVFKNLKDIHDPAVIILG